MFLKSLIINKITAGLFLNPLLALHSACYRWISRFAIALNGDNHPKRSIINYEKWFCDNIESGWCVLDIGCNTGSLAKKIAQKAVFVYGIDINPDLIKKANADNPADNIEYICADANTFDYKIPKSIDCIIMSNLLEHIEDRIGLLKKITGSVMSNGQKTLLIRVPTIERDWLAVYKKNLGVSFMLDKTHHIEYTTGELANELMLAGIKIKKMEIRFGEIYAVCSAL